MFLVGDMGHASFLMLAACDRKPPKDAYPPYVLREGFVTIALVSHDIGQKPRYHYIQYLRQAYPHPNQQTRSRRQPHAVNDNIYHYL